MIRPRMMKLAATRKVGAIMSDVILGSVERRPYKVHDIRTL